MLWKPEISAGLMGHLACMQTVPSPSKDNVHIGKVCKGAKWLIRPELIPVSVA